MTILLEYVYHLFLILELTIFWNSITWSFHVLFIWFKGSIRLRSLFLSPQVVCLLRFMKKYDYFSRVRLCHILVPRQDYFSFLLFHIRYNFFWSTTHVLKAWRNRVHHVYFIFLIFILGLKFFIQNNMADFFCFSMFTVIFPPFSNKPILTSISLYCSIL